MNATLLKKLFQACGFLALLAAGSRAWGGTLVMGPDSRLWLEGDSTLHVYHSTATQVSASGQAQIHESVSDVLKSGAVEAFEVTVPVQGLKSGKKGLDQNMQKALKAGQHPTIIFRLVKFSAEPAGQGVFQVQAEGSLSVAGQEKPVTLSAQAEAKGPRLIVRGKQELLMSEFGIKPPVMMLGAIKTRDKVVVHYDIVLEAR